MTNTWEKAEVVFPRMGIVACSFTRKKEEAGEGQSPGNGIFMVLCMIQ